MNMIMASPCFCISKLLLVSMFLLSLLVAESYSPAVQPNPMLCRAEEASALFQFKESFVIDKLASYDPLAYPKVDSWTLHGDCCSWDGVDCDDDGHVIGLDLTSSCLFGSIHSNSTLFNLNHLQRLSLADNDFNYSPIPPELALLSTTLTHLNLSMSLFSGQIPSEISMLSKLVVLDLGENVESSSSSSESLLQLKKPIFTSLVKNLTKLEVVVLSYVNISSTVPNMLSNLSSLSALYLKSCNLVGEFPSSVFLLPNLEYISIRFNQDLTGHLPQFNPSPLKSLRVGQTGFSGELPNSIQNLHSLTRFDVEDCNFTGPIPSCLGNLTSVTYLDLGSNFLQGPVQKDIFLLPNLEYISIRLNKELTGRLPQFNQSSLESISVAFTSFSGELPNSIQNLPSLTMFDVRKCNFTGPIPSSLGNLTGLTYLDLGSNFLQGPVEKDVFSKLVNLEALYLSENNLSGTLELSMFHEMRNLSELFLMSNQFSIVEDCNGTFPNLHVLHLGSLNLDKFPNFLKHQQKLSWLFLGSNKISGQVPSWFCNTSKETLSFLFLGDNSLTGLDQCTSPLPWLNLKLLDLSDNLLRGSLPPPPPSITSYDVSNNRLTGEIPHLFCNLSSLSHLELNDNNLSGELPPCLGNMSNLSQLILNNNNFTGTIPHMCTNVPSVLEGMDLSKNQLQGEIPRSLANCQRLIVIDVGHNAINDTFPFWMGKLHVLQVLILRSNRFHGPILDSSASTNSPEFPSLRIIDLSRNDFSGPLPSVPFCKWKAMTKSNPIQFSYIYTNESIQNDKTKTETTVFSSFSVILGNKGSEVQYRKIPNELAAVDFSSNKFSGEIPESIGNLNGMYVLNLANNQLRGSIPSSLANLTVLESLDLSNNNLSGEIPQQLVDVTSLAYFNVSHNNLEGRVPHGNQFDTFGDSSFDGNPELCGELLIIKRCRGSAPPSSVHICSGNCEDVESSFPSKWDWIVMAMGYAGGLVVGIVIGNELMAKNPKWFAKLFGTKTGKRRSRI